MLCLYTSTAFSVYYCPHMECYDSDVGSCRSCSSMFESGNSAAACSGTSNALDCKGGCEDDPGYMSGYCWFPDQATEKCMLGDAYTPLGGTNGYCKGCPIGCTTLTHCKAGYYKSGTSCVICPCMDGTNNCGTGTTSNPRGTSVDYNNGGINTCYIPSGTSSNNTTGTYVFTSNCNHS